LRQDRAHALPHDAVDQERHVVVEHLEHRHRPDLPTTLRVRIRGRRPASRPSPSAAAPVSRCDFSSSSSPPRAGAQKRSCSRYLADAHGC
jgi:hypothetical protein